MVEKDVVQSLFLYELSKSEMPFVFKGGTSLSKAYGLIDRFSEDIDLSASRRPTEAERRKIKDLIVHTGEDLGLHLNNPEEIQSRHSYNRYEFVFDSLFGEATQGMIVETSFYQRVYPSELHKVDSFVGRYPNFKADGGYYVYGRTIIYQDQNKVIYGNTLMEPVYLGKKLSVTGMIKSIGM